MLKESKQTALEAIQLLQEAIVNTPTIDPLEPPKFSPPSSLSGVVLESGISTDRLKEMDAALVAAIRNESRANGVALYGVQVLNLLRTVIKQFL